MEADAGRLAHWRIEFRAQRGGTKRWLAMALEVARAIGCTEAAKRMGRRIDEVWRWADGSAEVPEDAKPGLLGLWQDVCG